MRLEALELPSRPAQQRQIDVPEDRLQCGRRVSPVVLNPTPQEWVEPMGDIHQRQLRFSTKSQVSDRGPYLLQRCGAGRRVESPEQLVIPGILDQAGPEAVSEEVERDIRIHRFAVSVFTVDDPSFDGMQFQMAFRQACLKSSLEGFGFSLSSAVNQSIICIPTPKEVGIGPLHPQVERVMQEQIGQNGADYAPLRSATCPL